MKGRTPPVKILFTDLSDEELFAKMKQDNRRAFSELYKRYWQPLLDTAYRRLNSVEQAEELVQDLFVSLYLKRKEIEITSSLKAYLNTAIKYKILNEVRSAIVRSNYEKVALAELSYHPDASEQLNAKELQSEINRRLKLLPEKCREAFMLSREKNLSHKHIAEELGISVSTVEKHIGKALKVLRTDLREYQLDIILLITLLSDMARF